MKKSVKFFAFIVMAAALAFSFTSCEDDPVLPDDQTQQGENPGTDPDTDTENDENIFANTSWVSSLESSFSYQGIPMHIIMDGALDFMDSINGELFYELFVEVPMIPSANQEFNETMYFSYIVNGNIISITYQYEDPETHEVATETSDLVYDPENETITYDMGDDPEMEAIMGTNVMVFTKVQ